MKVDILSDLHLDFYFKPHLTTSENIISFFESIFTNRGTQKIGDVLIVAGDIGHNNKQNIEVLKILQKKFYKHIICVLGNHDYYLIGSEAKYAFKNNSFLRIEDMQKRINQEENLHCLDGTVVTIDGVQFGGANSWYDGSYVKKYFPSLDNSDINLLWRENINDSNLIKGISWFDEIHTLEMKKLENIYKNCDVMITHVNPSFDEKHIDKKYHNSPINTFFTFDGSKFYKNGFIKYWVFGHTHDSIEYTMEDVNFLCNPLGYPYESNYGEGIIMKSFEI
ncbi:metallophosphoesterase [Sulfurimonas sp. NW7]|uniref:metallophosphoesterase n=1 Tax=Sulfurimonas sp. NW7 TaxID=2922727 RepID=UPI003DA97B2F